MTSLPRFSKTSRLSGPPLSARHNGSTIYMELRCIWPQAPGSLNTKAALARNVQHPLMQ
jgi:hypothetical protein